LKQNAHIHNYNTRIKLDFHVQIWNQSSLGKAR